MSTPAEPIHVTGVVEKPKDVKEFSLRAVIASVAVAAVMGASYPYIVLKLGFGPNVSVVAAFFGFLALGLVFRNYNRWENNIVQTAGTSAAQTAFMCVLLAAFDMLRMNGKVKFDFTLSPLQAFGWLTAAGFLGVLLAVPMRQHFIVNEKLTFADGVATAETLIVLDSRGSDARRAALMLLIATIASGLVMVLQQPQVGGGLLPETLWPTLFGLTYATMATGLSTSLLSLGSGMLVGTRINASMLLGTILAWILAPKLLLSHGIIGIAQGAHDPKRLDVLRWVMWPATGMLVAGSLTALFMRWRILMKTFRHFSAGAVKGDEFPLKWVGAGVVVSALALIIIQKISLDLPIWMTIVAIIFSLPLMLVGLRVLGETNWGPISALSNMMQGIFAAVAPGHVAANMASSGTTGTIATSSEALMQDYKTGHLIGSSPRYMTYAQLIAVPIGAAAVSIMYPILKKAYGIGGENGLSSPISAKWAGFAELLSAGLSALPSGALLFLGIFTGLGIVLTVLEGVLPEKVRNFLPSPTGIGIGMLVPASAIISMFLGGLVAIGWKAAKPKNAETYLTPVASGLIAGEAIVAVVLAVLIGTGVMK